MEKTNHHRRRTHRLRRRANERRTLTATVRTETRQRPVGDRRNSHARAASRGHIQMMGTLRECALTRVYSRRVPLLFPHCQRRPATAQPSHHGNNNEITKAALGLQVTRGGQRPALSRGRTVHTDGDTTSATPAASGASPARKCFTRATISFRFPSTTGRSAKDPK